jgi:hypothetical protein
MFSVLFYNVYGLPSMWEKRAEERVSAIGKLITTAARHNYIGFQELWCANYLETSLPEFSGIRYGNLQTFSLTRQLTAFLLRITSNCTAPIASGLSFARTTPEIVPKEYRFIPFGSCNGVINRKKDCLADKGVLYERIEIPIPGKSVPAAINAFMVHLESGNKREDVAVRDEHIRTVERVVTKQSLEHPHAAIIIGGDFNYCFGKETWRTSSKRFESFSSRLRLTNANPLTGSEGEHKCLDHIFFKNGEGTHLELVESGVDDILVTSPRGQRLSNHPPIFARFRILKK